MRGKIGNNLLIVYSLTNISAANYQNRLMWTEVTVITISVSFFSDTVYIKYCHIFTYGL